MKAVERELKNIEKAERRMYLRAEKYAEPVWRRNLEEKIPEKVLTGLQKAFSKVFILLFENGAAVIEKTFDRECLEKEFQIKDYALDLKGGRKEVRRLKRDDAGSSAAAALFTAVEGVGLGVLGIGLPDILIWVGILLRGVYETALKYGFDYESPAEKRFILKMMEASMAAGGRWITANAEVDRYLRQGSHAPVSEAQLKEQIEKTADAFAADLLVLKFIQGIPVVGMIGGAANPLYYQRVMKYVQLKYRKRYLLSKVVGHLF